jgi:hypothetical protein
MPKGPKGEFKFQTETVPALCILTDTQLGLQTARSGVCGARLFRAKHALAPQPLRRWVVGHDKDAERIHLVRPP